MSHPYLSVPPEGFWKTAVADRSPFEISNLWAPKFPITPDSRIVTAGSCFAQHFGRALVARGYNWLDAEPGPHGLSPQQRHDYHYGAFSFRTGNIYTPRMMRQWLQWALGHADVPDEVWQKDGRYFDPFRPAVEPGGFSSPDELRLSRADTLAAIRESVVQANVFVFTLGLTEAWQSADGLAEYAVCPGTVAGTFDAERHKFVNHPYRALVSEMTAIVKLLTRANRSVKILLTVSPVPLTATATGHHVLLASSHSKSMLRAVVGAMADSYPAVDYFPSYEFITNPVFRGMFFGPNMRSVTQAGVDFVMANFFRDQATAYPPAPRRRTVVRTNFEPPLPAQAADPAVQPSPNSIADLHCEEEILSAFAR